MLRPDCTMRLADAGDAHADAHADAYPSLSRAKAAAHDLRTRHIAHLNGLRALAFTGVLLFHFRRGCAGGFLGVDVFFVLSGYLMTRSLAAQLGGGAFSYPAFIARRFWRLYPALLVTMLATLALTYGLFSSEHAVQVGRSAVASLLGASNVLFLSEEGYFGTSSILKPLLHTWSLSVEWQFYLIWPLLMAVSQRWLSRPVATLPLLALCLASFAHGVNLATSAPAAAFFLLPGRAFEFGVGALAATAAPTISSALVGNAMSAAGTALIALSFVYINASHGAPALIALPALVGALLVIVSPSTVACNRLYTSFLGDYLGRISYSAYLVHWPVYVFFVNIFEESAAPWHVELVVLTGVMCISTLLHHHVEDEYRSGKRLLHKWVGAALVACTLAASAWCLHTRGWEERYSPKLGRDSAALSERGLRKEFDVIYDPHDQAVRAGGPDKFEFGYIPKTTERRIDKGDRFAAAIVGDSFAAPLAGVFAELAAEEGAQYVLTSRHSCTPFLDDTSMDASVLDFDNPTNNPRVADCKRHIRGEMLELIRAARTDVVVLIGNWLNTQQMRRAAAASVSSIVRADAPDAAHPGSWTRAVSQLELTVARLTALGKKVVLVGMVPGAHYNARACYAAKGPLTFLKQCPAASRFDAPAGGRMARRAAVRRTLGLLMAEAPGLVKAQADGRLVYVDPYLSLCRANEGTCVVASGRDPYLSLCRVDEGTCVVASGREPYYYDEGHLTKNGSLLLKHDIQQALWLLRNHKAAS